MIPCEPKPLAARPSPLAYPMDDAIRWQGPFEDDRKREPKANTARFGGDDDRPVLVAVLNGPIEAEMARDALAEAGIPALIKRETAAALYGLTVGSLARAEVWTPPALAERARDLLVGIGLVGEE